VGASVAWYVVAPVYADGLAVVARQLLPSLEGTPGTRYGADGSRVQAYRPVRLPGEGRARDRVDTIWAASASFGLPFFVALVLATPGWSVGVRIRSLAVGLIALSLIQVATMVVTGEYWQQTPIRRPDGSLFYLPSHSPLRWQVSAALYNFAEIMGKGFFSLLVFLALVVLLRPSEVRARPNESCPCGSGRKFKRCCAQRVRC